MRVASTHPVHIIDNKSQMTTSAFIPFCAFDGDMSIVGTDVENFSIPVCSSFSPRILDGQLCYHTAVEKLFDEKGTKWGKEHGLTLLLDYNEDLSLDGVTDPKHNKAKVYLNTLEAFIGYGDGLYEMSAMKAKATTSSFLALSETERGCQTEKTNLECRQENFQELAKSCNCTPFSLADSTTQPLVSGHL